MTDTITMQALANAFAHHKQVKAVERALLTDDIHTLHLAGLQASASPMLFAALWQMHPRLMLFVLGDEEEAGYFYNDLSKLLDDEAVAFFPSSYKRAVKFAQRHDANEILRTDVLTRLTTYHVDKGLYIVTYPEALSERVTSLSTLSTQTIRIEQGQSMSLTVLEQQLFALGFTRADYVYAPGEFAIRGSIVDVYSFTNEHPFRIDFFGDEVDSLRTFDIQTQLSVEPLKAVSIVPSVRQTAEGGETFFQNLPAEAITIFRDYTFVRDRIKLIYDEGFTTQAQAEAEAMGSHLDSTTRLIDATTFGQACLPFRRIDIGARSSSADAVIRFDQHVQPLFHKQFDLVAHTLDDLQRRGYTIYIGAESHKQLERLRAIFAQLDSNVRFVCVDNTLHAGFIDADFKVAVFTDHQIFDRFHKYQLKNNHVRNAKVALTLKELQQFEYGDYIVHVDHGIGQFAGLMKIPTGDTLQEVIKINYQRGDAVFVSIHALHKISKYKGRDGEAPKLSSLGSGAWEKLKDRTKRKLKDIARDLIALYAKRRGERGHQFAPDSFMQHELEASFKYEDTPDQLRVTQEVKADMESDRPMDRLVCGDVGFGKTEIAVRAAFKAACDGKQVAVMVPTTLLAYQHYRTFSERLKDFPVKVEYLSRARKASEATLVRKGLADGTVNIVVGTHALIGKQIQFKDLGLLIIDEEHKFGVSVKEKLRQLRVNIDTLTMSATPIPRTLQFSLMGARDLSTINTPPPNRHPIDTQVCTFSGEVIAEAINFELSRNGQVFVVSHRIANLPTLASLVTKHVPDARVAIAHGQMPPEAMEQTITDFVNHDFDVLISTTIVENGIDIANANTIIVENAHHFGLSDLHQMRGRVGRSNRKAFCYLLAPPLAALPPDSRRRLQAIESFSDLGSGIHIAMQDLDIRGAGNLLGAEQSGFVADLGYETYQKILKEAMAELRNEEFADLFESEDEVRANDLSGEVFVDECQLESDLRLFLPEGYVPGNSERLLLYRELDGMTRPEEVTAFRTRLEDRFGPLPLEAEHLLQVPLLRAIGRRLGCERIVLKGGRLTLHLVSHSDSAYFRSVAFGRIIAYVTTAFQSCELAKSGKPRLFIHACADVPTALALMQTIEATPPVD